MENSLLYSEWGDYFNAEKKAKDHFSLDKKTKAIAFGTSRKIKNRGKKWNIMEEGYHIVNEGTILALRRKQRL